MQGAPDVLPVLPFFSTMHAATRPGTAVDLISAIDLSSKHSGNLILSLIVQHGHQQNDVDFFDFIKPQ